MNILDLEQQYKVRYSNKGEDAIIAVEKFPIDLILLDIGLPDIDGYEVCKRINSNHEKNNIPVIFLTGKTNVRDKAKGFDVGGIDYLTKPYHSLELLARVKTHIELNDLRKNLQKEVEKQTKEAVNAKIEAENANKLKDEFIVQIVHEMLSPLTEILHKVNRFENLLLRTNSNKTELENYYNSVKNTIFLFKHLLLGLESIAFNKNKDPFYIFEMENIHNMIFDCKILLEPKAHYDKQILIETYLKGLPPLRVDHCKITQVFINLIRNAINYSYEGTKIEIYYKETEEYFKNSKYHIWHEIKFENTGTGIPERDKDDIFKLYRRGSNASKLIPSGAGIGLYLVKKIMNAHNGMCIIRKLDKPTIISILFPKK